jgi:hypothetical protein
MRTSHLTTKLVLHVSAICLVSILAGLFYYPVAPVSAQGGDRLEPRINRDFPIDKEGQLSPPMVAQPIHECAQAVHVSGFISHATVQVFANGSELIGQAVPHVGFADISLTRALNLGDKITATQSVSDLTSLQSYDPVVVSPFPTIPGGLNKPEVGADLYACGIIVPVGKLVESVTVHVFADGVEIGTASAPNNWQPVFTKSLVAGQKVTAVQVACEGTTGKTITSPVSDAVVVKPEPNPVQSPVLDPASLIVGNETVTLNNLYVGAEVNVSSNSTQIGGGFATGPSNWTAINPPLEAGASITAQQKLCAVSPVSESAEPTTDLRAPKVLEPICAGSQYVIIRDTVIGANVVLFRNGTIVGYAGGVPGDLIMAMGGGAKWNAGDVVTARQYMDTTLSPVSNSVTVVDKLGAPAVEILGGEPFFLAESGEQAIDGPVFPRGRGDGPLIAVHSCCDKEVKAQVLRGSTVIADVPLTAQFPGYYTGRWDWKSKSNWKIPGDIPVGSYHVQVTTQCGQEPAKAKFYVIFNPADVAGPDRFSFNETGIWFGTNVNTTFAVVYHLHPDDARVFQKALSAVEGLTEPLNAATKVTAVEEALFGWSLDNHGNDVIVLMNMFSVAQCADDANVLTSMLRAIGIPAHPATADAALETGMADWNYDTWTEFLVPNGSSPEWLILHPHQYPGEAPSTRSDFGATKGVATKSFNDLVVMAGENWNTNEVADGFADVTFERSSCREPLENHLSHSAWLLDLCENIYWNPNHWSCTGTTSSNLSIEISGLPDSFNLGDTVSGVLAVTNRTAGHISTHLSIEVVADLPYSKRFPDEVGNHLKKAVHLEAHQQTEIPFQIKLPRTLRPGHNLMLRVRSPEKDYLLAPVHIEPKIDVTVKDIGRRRVGGDLVVTGAVTNRSKDPQRVSVALSTPPGLSVTNITCQLGVLMKPGERREFAWRVKALAPLEAGSLEVTATVNTGGWAQGIAPISIPASATNPTSMAGGQ